MIRTAIPAFLLNHGLRPDVLPAGARDLSVPRIAARTLGSSGFLFVNNHIRGYPMPARPNFQVETLTLPSKPITLPADAYFVWPLHMDLSGLYFASPPPNPSPSSAPKTPPSTSSSANRTSPPSSSSTMRRASRTLSPSAEA